MQFSTSVIFKVVLYTKYCNLILNVNHLCVGLINNYKAVELAKLPNPIWPKPESSYAKKLGNRIRNIIQTALKVV